MVTKTDLVFANSSSNKYESISILDKAVRNRSVGKQRFVGKIRDQLNVGLRGAVGDKKDDHTLLNKGIYSPYLSLSLSLYSLRTIYLISSSFITFDF